jgi:hypothetical protein
MLKKIEYMEVTYQLKEEVLHKQILVRTKGVREKTRRKNAMMEVKKFLLQDHQPEEIRYIKTFNVTKNILGE